MNVLVLNPGSSTLKFAFYSSGRVLQQATVSLATTGLAPGNHEQSLFHRAIEEAIRTIAKQLPSQPDAIGYRVVHGGRLFSGPTKIDDAVVEGIRSLIALAPLHQPYGVAAIEMTRVMYPDQLHVACFDTAFHASLPDVESRLPIPKRFFEQGIQRYGFHGLSYESISLQLKQSYSRFVNRNVVVCHLGNGASICGMRNLKSCYTSMSFTPLDGLMMGTRSGRLDPGVILHWLRNGYTAGDVERVLLKESGLLGVSGLSYDMRELLAAEASDEDCRLALEQFGLSVAQHIVAAAASLGGLEAIVFTAGIGENCPAVRDKIVDRLRWLGVQLDENLNAQNQAGFLHHAKSSISVLKLMTDEQLVIANQAKAMLDEGV